MKRWMTLLVLAPLLRLISAGIALAHIDVDMAVRAPSRDQSAGDYELTWWTVDGGGATFRTGGDRAIGGTSGQPDAAVWSWVDYTVRGGFWGRAAVHYHVYLPMALRSG